MVFEYFKNSYKGKLTGKMPNLNVDEIASICRTDKNSGTRITEDLLKELEKTIGILKFKIVRDATFEEIDQAFKKNLPCIVLYDCGLLQYKISSNVGHAGVVISINEDTIILNNPWLGAETSIKKIDFNDAWEMEFKSVVFIEPNLQTKLI
jgi:predicted double-glycine peptidase